jgi:hypothetical protein
LENHNAKGANPDVLHFPEQDQICSSATGGHSGGGESIDDTILAYVCWHDLLMFDL